MLRLQLSALLGPDSATKTELVAVCLSRLLVHL